MPSVSAMKARMSQTWPASPGSPNSMASRESVSTAGSVKGDPFGMSFNNTGEDNMRTDGSRLDPHFEDVCRGTVGFQTQQLVVGTLSTSRIMSKEGGIGGESLFTTSPSRLANYFRGDGAVYAQYDINQASYSGGALPEPWCACMSRSTGKVYYHNPDTQENRWEPPLYPLSRNWRMELSPQSGAVFYVHKESGKWQWKRPVDEQFSDLQGAGHADMKALQIWRDRNPSLDPNFAGLERLPAAQKALEALPPPLDPRMAALVPVEADQDSDEGRG